MGKLLGRLEGRWTLDNDWQNLGRGELIFPLRSSAYRISCLSHLESRAARDQNDAFLCLIRTMSEDLDKDGGAGRSPVVLCSREVEADFRSPRRLKGQRRALLAKPKLHVAPCATPSGDTRAQWHLHRTQ